MTSLKQILEWGLKTPLPQANRIYSCPLNGLLSISTHSCLNIARMVSNKLHNLLIKPFSWSSAQKKCACTASASKKCWGSWLFCNERGSTSKESTPKCSTEGSMSRKTRTRILRDLQPRSENSSIRSTKGART